MLPQSPQNEMIGEKYKIQAVEQAVICSAMGAHTAGWLAGFDSVIAERLLFFDKYDSFTNRRLTLKVTCFAAETQRYSA
jgi:hypothetical protein